MGVADDNIIRFQNQRCLVLSFIFLVGFAFSVDPNLITYRHHYSTGPPYQGRRTDVFQEGGGGGGGKWDSNWIDLSSNTLYRKCIKLTPPPHPKRKPSPHISYAPAYIRPSSPAATPLYMYITRFYMSNKYKDHIISNHGGKK